MKNKFIIIIMLVFGSFSFFGQSLEINGHDWGSPEVTSDYGRRECSCSKFHDGVDFANASIPQSEVNQGLDITSVNSGRIHEIYLNQNYKVIIIAGNNGVNIGYGHIFEDIQPTVQNAVTYGHFMAAYVDQLQDYVIIYNPNLTGSYMLTDLSDEELEDIEDFTFLGQSYSVNKNTILNDVVAGETRIAPLGNSGGNYPNHLHLYSFTDLDDSPWQDNNKTKDPLTHLSNITGPYYDVSLEMITSGTYNGYSSFPINPSFKVRADFSADVTNYLYNKRYKEHTLDLNTVELRIKSKSENVFNTIRGAYFYSRISEGATKYTNSYPNIDRPFFNTDFNIYDSKISDSNSAGFGGYLRNGIVGSSYYENRNPGNTTDVFLPSHVSLNTDYGENVKSGAWEDYFFNDFPTRIAESDKSFGRGKAEMCPYNDSDLCRYSDGIYEVYAAATDIEGSEHHSPSKELIIDNFKPYVRSVVLRSLKMDDSSTSYYPEEQNGELIYKAEWTWDGTSLKITPENQRQLRLTESFESFWLEVEFSESIFEQIDSENNSHLSLNGIQTEYVRYNSDKTKFYYIIDYIEPTLSIQLSIDGKDSAGNKLQTDPSVISIKQADGSWFPEEVPGPDENHTFNTGNYCSIPIDNQVPSPSNRMATIATSSASCAPTGFIADNRIPSPYSPVVFSAFVIGDNYEYQWDFGADAIPETLITDEPEVTVIYTEEGNKDVSLTMVNLATSEEIDITESSFIGVGQSVVPLSVNFTSPSTIGVGNEITFQANVSGGDGNLNYYWDFGKNASVISNSGGMATVSYNSEGLKTIQLTVSDNTQSKTTTKFNHVNVNGYSSRINISGDINISQGIKVNDIVCEPPHVIEGDWVREGGVSNNTYYWDFGDGSYSSEVVGTHTYNVPGSYTVSLTVCDLSGCDQTSETVYMDPSWFPLPEEDEPEIFINGKESWTTSEHIKHFRPFKLTTILPDELDSDDVKFEINYTDYSNIQRNLTTYTGVGPHTLVHNASHKRYGVSLKYYIASTGEYESADYLDVYPGGGSDDLGLDYGEYFGTSVSNMRLSTYCYDEDERPRLLFDRNTPDNGDELLFTCQVFQDGQEVDNYTLYPGRDYVMSSLNKNLIFPVSLKFTAEWIRYDVGKDDYDDEKIEPIGVFETVIYGLEEIEMPESYTMCSGATQIIGVENPNDKFDYQWSSASSALYLSDLTSPNPEFSGVVDGTYNYSLTMTDKETGCFDEQQVQITVGDVIDVYSYNYGSLFGASIKAGSANRTLVAPVHSGASDYDFEWSPSDFLDNPYSATPTFLTPRYGVGIEYEVTIRHRGCSETVATVFVGVSNSPPSLDNLEVFEDGSFGLDWRPNGIASEYVIEKKEEGSSDWEIIAETNKVTAFSDMECIDPSKEYCYRILAYDINGDFMGYSDEECGRAPFNLYPKWSRDIEEVFTSHSTYGITTVVDGNKIIRYGDLFNYDDDEILLLSAYDQGSSYVVGKNGLTAIHINKETGVITSTVKPDFAETSRSSYQSAVYSDGSYYIASTIGNVRGHRISRYKDGMLTWFKDINQAIIFGSMNASVVQLSLPYTGQKIAATVTSERVYGSDDIDETGVVRYLIDVSKTPFNVLSTRQVTPSGAIAQSVSNEPNYGLEIIPIQKKQSTHNVLDVAKGFLYEEPIMTAFIGHEVDLDFSTVTFENAIIKPLNDGNHLVFGTTISARGNYFVGKLEGIGRRPEPAISPYFIWQKQIKGVAGSYSRLIDVIVTGDTSDPLLSDYILVGRTNSGKGNDKSQDSSGTVIWMVCVDSDGNIKWDSTIDYDLSNNVFDVVLTDDGDFVFAAIKDASNDLINISSFSTEKIFEPLITICEDVDGDDSRSAQAERIIVGDDCEIEFSKSSHTQLVATKSITFGPGTYIEEKSYVKGKIDKNRIENCDLFQKTTTSSKHISTVESNVDIFENSNNVDVFEDAFDGLISVYPNPTSETFNIDLSGFENQDYKILIYQIDGKFTGIETSGYYSGESVTLDVSNLPSGIYYMNIELKKSGQHKGKVIVHK